MNSLFDLVDGVGFDAIDAEIEEWIDQGVYDQQVLTRAKELDTMESPVAVWQQEIHRSVHPRGPYGYEHCAMCILALGL